MACSTTFPLRHALPFLAALARSLPGAGQCIHTLDRMDEFTHRREVEITASSFSHGPVFSWCATAGQRMLRITWEQEGHVPAVVFQGDTLMLKLDTDSVLVLVSDNTFTGIPGHDGQGREITTGVYSYRVTPRHLALLAAHWVSRLRIYFRDGYQEFDARPDPAWQFALARSAGCFQDTFTEKAPVAPVSTTSGGTP